MQEKIYTLLIYFPIFLISLTVHEFCHGFVAFRKGDPTAKFMGRLTLNPIPHMDPIGTVLFPIFSILFGGVYFAWAKPAPVDPRNFKHRVNDMFWVALAGPFSNFVLAFLSAWLYGMTLHYGPSLFQEKTIFILMDVMQMSIYLNLALFFFNLIPVAPLDGSKIIGRFLPTELRHVFENINPMVGAMALLLLFLREVICG